MFLHIERKGVLAEGFWPSKGRGEMVSFHHGSAVSQSQAALSFFQLPCTPWAPKQGNKLTGTKPEFLASYSASWAKGKRGTFRGPASRELSRLLFFLFLSSCQTACGQQSQASGSPGQLGKARPFQTPVSLPTSIFSPYKSQNWRIIKTASKNGH